MRGGADEFLFARKAQIKTRFIYPRSKPDFRAFRETFPEANRQTLRHFFSKKTWKRRQERKKALVWLLAALHMDAAAAALLWVARKTDKRW